ncbi:MAG: alpha/beta fold hydrolase [Blautia sp.]|nr:alpha/beta fold hydrolase [Blautia sp.]
MLHCKRKRVTDHKKAFSGNRVFQISHIKDNHPKVHYKEAYEKGKKWCQNQMMQDRYIYSEDGLRLHGYFLKTLHAKRVVILCHGYRGNSFSDFAHVARFLYENECDLLFIDQRCCGQSEGEYITFGAKEKKDVRDWVYYLAKQSELPIYLFGESLGAASVLMASEYRLPKQVHGIIADCGFCSMKKQMKDMASKWFHINRIDLLLLQLMHYGKLVADFQVEEADTLLPLQRNMIPVLLFHGENDTFVYPENSRINYKRCNSEKELVMIPNAKHMCAGYEEPELYREKITAFFKKCDYLP